MAEHGLGWIVGHSYKTRAPPQPLTVREALEKGAGWRGGPERGAPAPLVQNAGPAPMADRPGSFGKGRRMAASTEAASAAAAGSSNAARSITRSPPRTTAPTPARPPASECGTRRGRGRRPSPPAPSGVGPRHPVGTRSASWPTCAASRNSPPAPSGSAVWRCGRRPAYCCRAREETPPVLRVGVWCQLLSGAQRVAGRREQHAARLRERPVVERGQQDGGETVG